MVYVQTESVQENETLRIFIDFEIQRKHLIEAGKLDQV